MEVACPECGTRFSLDQSRIPGSSAKVRCSRCRHVFRINREGQVVAPDWAPPGEIPEETPPREEVREEIPETPLPEPVEPLTPPEKETFPEEVIPPPSAAPEADILAPSPEKKRHWLWLPALLLVLVVLLGLGWRAWQGDLPGLLKPLADVIQRLKGEWGQAKQSTPATVGQEAGAKPVAPTKVTPPPPPVTAQDLQDLPVDWAQAHYQGLVNDKGGGQLLVITGEVLNKGKEARGPIRIKATLTDSQHLPLREEVAYAGTTCTDKELKTLSPGEIKAWLAKPGGRSQERVVKPGGGIPFTVVFFGVPDNLAETQSGFQIVVVEGPVVAD